MSEQESELESHPDLGALLLRSVEEFNAWRLAHLDAPIDLSGYDLRGADLRHAFLVGAQLDGAQLDDAALTGAALSGASLKGALLRRADLRRGLFGRAELMDAKLAFSALGRSLHYGADLQGASLEGARADEAVFLDADLRNTDLTDCDLSTAQMKNAQLDGAKQGPAPPKAGDGMGALARLAKEPRPVRMGLALFAGMVYLSGPRTADDEQFMSNIVTGIGLGQADFSELFPGEPLPLEEQRIEPTRSHWNRRVYFALMCALASSAPPSELQLNVFSHFGTQLDFAHRAMARLLREELQLDIRAEGQRLVLLG